MPYQPRDAHAPGHWYDELRLSRHGTWLTTFWPAWRTLTGAPPAGWATAEPINVPWSPRQLTDLARTRAQQSLPPWIAAVGAPDRPAIATMRTVRTHAGVEEHITLATGYGADQSRADGSEQDSDMIEDGRLASDLATLRAFYARAAEAGHAVIKDIS
ncbi:DUF6177 family protein [Streptomyces sp. NPDC047515]|uniref:DUF6177 family protein n=1 Tax=Streptomyces sp. NPDC047515 TaxID=3155380 RepID=UPI0033C8AF23